MGSWEGGVCISSSFKASETPKAMPLKVYLEDMYWIGRFQGPTSSNYNFALPLINTNKDKLQKEIWAKRGLHKSQTKIATLKKN